MDHSRLSKWCGFTVCLESFHLYINRPPVYKQTRWVTRYIICRELTRSQIYGCTVCIRTSLKTFSMATTPLFTWSYAIIQLYTSFTSCFFNSSRNKPFYYPRQYQQCDVTHVQSYIALGGPAWLHKRFHRKTSRKGYMTFHKKLLLISFDLSLVFVFVFVFEYFCFWFCIFSSNIS